MKTFIRRSSQTSSSRSRGCADGTYVLENQVNPDQVLPESDYTNNFAAVKFYYTSRHGNTPASVQIIP
jgi:lysyl oxidase